MISSFARLRGSLPWSVADAIFHLPVRLERSTPRYCDQRGFRLHRLEEKRVVLPHFIDGSDERLRRLLSEEVHVPPQGECHFAAIIPGGRVLGRTCTATTPDGGVLADVSPDEGRGHRPHRALSTQLFARAPSRLTGTSLLVGGVGHANFYHWMFDMLPRIGLARAAGLPEPDRWIVPSTKLGVSRALLTRCGVDASRCIALGRFSHLHCDQLIVTSAPGWICEPQPRTASFLREALGLATPPDSGKRIYLGRRGRRKLVNEQAVISALQPLGFKEVYLEGLGLDQQIDAVAGASCVVAPHGAGLAHLVHARPFGALIEILPEDYPNPTFALLAGACGMSYGCVAAKRASGAREHRTRADICVDPVSVRALVDSALAMPALNPS